MITSQPDLGPQGQKYRTRPVRRLAIPKATAKKNTTILAVLIMSFPYSLNI